MLLSVARTRAARRARLAPSPANPLFPLSLSLCTLYALLAFWAAMEDAPARGPVWLALGRYVLFSQVSTTAILFQVAAVVLAFLPMRTLREFGGGRRADGRPRKKTTPKIHPPPPLLSFSL
jgi:hypothetical protein